MKNLTLHSELDSKNTVISNRFIEEFMPYANGEYVKIYLYLLYCMNANENLSLSIIADRFDHTEKDVARALKYWEKMHLLKLEYDEKKSLTGICLSDILSVEDNVTSDLQQPTVSKVSEAEAVAVKEPLTKDQVKDLQSREEIKQLLFIAEQYLGKTLSPTEITVIMEIYDSFHFSFDLMEYLIEYCVSKNHKSIHYIKSVASAWYEENIKTVTQAKKSTTLYTTNCFTVLKTFGITGRNPGDSEIAYINKWTNEYGFTLDIIIDACNRTIEATHQPSFKYADKILEDWKKKNVKHPSDIQALDEKHKTKAANTNAANSNVAKNETVYQNKFNNFENTAYDFTLLEKELLNN